MNAQTLLMLREVDIQFPSKSGMIKIAESISFDLKVGETLCLLGESGSGKSLVALAIPGLLPHNAIAKGRILYRGKDLLSRTDKELTKIRGKDIAMIFEQPMGCLNPMMTVGEQIAESLYSDKENGKGKERWEARKEAKRRMDEVGIPDQRFSDYPHELSGGMQQRVMIAMALACNPKLLIADEPTTALDLTLQRQILDLLNDLKQRYNTSLLIVTHDLGVAAEMSDSVAVMYAGRLMEHAPVQEFFARPAHPYSRALLNIISGEKLQPIPGNVPNLMELPEGCPYHPRCEHTLEECRKTVPPSTRLENRMVRCHNALCN
ncbi:MAG: ABC transporter ATP-binding protein [Pseudomonadota bacterium]